MGCFLFFIFLSFFLEAKPRCKMSLTELIDLEPRAVLEYGKQNVRIAAIIAAEKDGKILLLYRIGSGANERLTWGLAGGSMEPEDSSLVSAAVREFGEETELWIKPERMRLVGRMDYSGKDDSRFYASYIFLVRLKDDEAPQILGDEKERLGGAKFFDVDAPPLNRFSSNTAVFNYFRKMGFDVLTEDLVDLNQFVD